LEGREAIATHRGIRIGRISPSWTAPSSRADVIHALADELIRLQDEVAFHPFRDEINCRGWPMFDPAPKLSIPARRHVWRSGQFRRTDVGMIIERLQCTVEADRRLLPPECNASGSSIRRNGSRYGSSSFMWH
jgi:hypothetical protein